MARGQAEEEQSDHPDDTTTKTLAPSKDRSVCYAAESAVTKFAKDLKSAARPLFRKRKCWEVYVGLGLVSYYVRLNNVEVKQFRLQSG